MIWHDVCARSDIPEGRGWPVTVEGRPVAVFADGGRLYALDNECLHVGSPLEDGTIFDGCLICPWHGWRYVLRTGDLLTVLGARPGLRAYPVRERCGRVLVGVDAPTHPAPG